MKIDKRNPLHWIYFVLFGVNTFCACLLRPLLRNKGQPIVLLYGHRYNGNLRAIGDYALRHAEPGVRVYFLTMDPAYYRVLRGAGDPALLAFAPASVAALALARCIVSDHGLHTMKLLLRCTDIKFADVWHGIPFKGFDADDLRVQRNYDEIWVASELHKSLYVNKFGFDSSTVHITGYARTDVLVRCDEDPNTLKRRLGISRSATKVVLVAPTWQHEQRGRSIYPFDVEAGEFLGALDTVCASHAATCIFRTHLNTTDTPSGDYPNIVYASSEEFSDSERLLSLSDLLICDWSSIAFDFLLLDRATIFLDVPAPFAKGFSLGPQYRFGEIAKDMDSLSDALNRYLSDDTCYWREHGDGAARIKREVYGSHADGRAAERCWQRLRAM